MSMWDSIKNRLKHELIDIVEFLDDSGDTLSYRFERFQNEIKNGAKCIVREGQAAVFINEGKLADVLPPGTYTLDTKNIPILATLLGWKYGFESPFKAEIYFVSTRIFSDQKWGTMNPVIVRDPEFGPVRLRAFGTYTIRVKDPGAFIKNAVGTDNRFTLSEINTQLRNTIVSHLGDALGESKIPLLDIAGRTLELSKFLGDTLVDEWKKFGLEVPTLLIENVSLPPEVEAALDKRSSMGVLGNLDNYAKFQAAEAIRDAAKNPGTAGTFVGVGVGQAFGNMIAGTTAGAAAGVAGAAPPPLPAFFLVINGIQAGPFDQSGLVGKVRSGELTPSSLVWRQGMQQWAPASSVGELAAVFTSVPPAIPGGPPPVPPR
ncbi:antifreeze protein, type I [Phycisphaerae bacterium]|nr:antifreeze protein, type I [Phycisphaerae bacterium]